MTDCSLIYQAFRASRRLATLIYGVVDNSENDIGRFNILYFCYSSAGLTAKAKFKDVKTPFLILASAYHAINGVANRREARKAAFMRLKLNIA